MANTAKLAADEGANEEQRGASEVTRTVIVRSKQLPSTFRASSLLASRQPTS
jgi:hypothetical protein